MTTGAIIITAILALLKLLVTCLPNDAVKWITKKFELHPEISSADTTISYEGKELSDSQKEMLVKHFNEAQFLKSQHIFPGNEELFLHPATGVTPVIIDTKQNKKDIRLYMFGYNDSIDIVKQHKKKLQAYTLSSEILQSHFPQVKEAMENPQFGTTA
ncbi:YfmQ family protein [Aciduricibacillus chroicocephali]|uniref:YfmQ family protein n=1 Tax=Aciduricibacillus chroicocephali TaxID=3054939 RepID=A0ABY9L073_9BACI|nr:YfmQ family protein [Bacillaceae bacterium 44XB]